MRPNSKGGRVRKRRGRGGIEREVEGRKEGRI